MKNILIALLIICGTNAKSQDTLCVMLTQDEVIHFDFYSTEIINRYDHSDDLTLNVSDGQVMCLHFYDKEERFRDLTTTFSNGDHIHGSFDSEDNVFFSDIEWGVFEVHISESKVKK